MKIRPIFQNANNEWRSGWRIVAMIALLAIVGVAVNVGWKALGLPGQKTGGPWMFLLFASLIAGLSFAGILLLLRIFEKRGADAIWMSFTSRAWGDTAAGALLGAVPICLLMGLALVAGYGTVGPGNIGLGDALPTLLPMLGAGFLLAAWEEFALRGYLLRQLSIGLNATAAVVITGVLAHYLTFGSIPELDHLGRPKVFYGQSIHDRCYRRPFYDKGQFAETFDDEGARKGWCLFKLGCKGPTTYNACATTKWNNGTSFPIESGHPCIGCSEPDFWDGGGFYKPLSLPTEDLSKTAVYTAAGAAVAGVAISALNRAKKNNSNKIHIKTTIDDLRK